MAGTLTEDTRSDGSSSNDQRCHSGESIAEWRSSEQVENGTPSTSPPPFYDTEDDDCGPKPSELYGKFTWKIEGFSQIQQTNKRELRSNSFDVGGYKWYILIYPQGCDVQNHLSLFLCVANHDKLLPGWSHFAQFTISVVNKDPKKSKYSDTLHRFWKKEHDWGWKKFMEISKLNDGFVVEDVLIIKAQVQVIRERADRPFRCLDVQYRRELVRVYLSNIDQICRRFIEDRRMKLSRLTDDKNRWSSFRSFWAGVDTSTKRRISREKTDTILKILVKQFFIEKEVTSTLVMDSMYSGLRSLEFQSNRTKVVAQTDESGFANSSYYPMVYVDQNHFVLSDDVVFLLEKAVSDTWPQLSSRDDNKSSHNRSKMEGGLCEETSNNNDKNNSFDRDNRRLTELGRRTVEFFALIQIFSRIEVAHQEAVALKRQEDLIREEEIEGIIENGKREKRAKKKQNKQKKNGKKGKDKGKNKDKIVIDTIPLKQDEIDPVITEVEEVMSDASDNASETPRKNDDDNDSSPTNWETDASETPRLLTEGKIGKENSFVDDSSSTCSTESYNNKGRKEKNKVKKSHENSENIMNNKNKNIEHESFDDVASEQEAVKNPTINMVDSNTAVKIEQNTMKLKSEMYNSSSSPSLIQPLNSPSNSPKALAEISPTTPTSLSSLSTVTSPLDPPKSSAEISPTTPKATPTSLSPVPSPKTEPIKQPTSPLKTPPNGMSRPSIPPNRPATPVPVSVSVPVPPVLPKAQQPVPVSKSFSDPNFVPTSYRNAIIGKNDVPDTAGTSSSRSTFSQLEIETKDEFERNEWIYAVPSISAEFERWRANRFAPVEFPQRASISGTVSDEFPHLDIINDLLDEDKASSPRGDPRLMQSRHRNYARQYSMPNNNRYNDQYGTSGTNNAHHLRRQYSQMDSMGFSNGYHVDEVALNRWPYRRGEYNMRRDMGGDNSNGFVYRQVNDYDYDINININNGMMNGIDAYRLYRPSNGY